MCGQLVYDTPRIFFCDMDKVSFVRCSGARIVEKNVRAFGHGEVLTLRLTQTLRNASRSCDAQTGTYVRRRATGWSEFMR